MSVIYLHWHSFPTKAFPNISQKISFQLKYVTLILSPPTVYLELNLHSYLASITREVWPRKTQKSRDFLSYSNFHKFYPSHAGFKNCLLQVFLEALSPVHIIFNIKNTWTFDQKSFSIFQSIWISFLSKNQYVCNITFTKFKLTEEVFAFWQVSESHIYRSEKWSSISYPTYGYEKNKIGPCSYSI